MGTTNYKDTFIAVAEDSTAVASEEPPARARPTVASLTYELLRGAPPYT
ncbi:DUF6157 family protein [Georgenia soli]|nr:DUF6157 family protein [Georgenia soli]